MSAMAPELAELLGGPFDGECIELQNWQLGNTLVVHDIRQRRVHAYEPIGEVSAEGRPIYQHTRQLGTMGMEEKGGGVA